MEEWRYIEKYNNLYMISNFGNIKSCGRYVHDSIGRTRFIKPKKLNPSETGKRKKTEKGYLEVRLTYQNGNNKSELVHVLVAEAFIPNPYNKPTVNHKDGNKHNNCVDNLEWNTYSENNQHAYDTHLKSDNVFVAKLDKNTNEVIDTYISLHQAGRENNANISNIHAVCNGKRNICGNYKWMYIPRTEVIEVDYEVLMQILNQ